MIESLPEQPLLEAVVMLAKQAGQAILGIYGSDFSFATKADQSPLTEADLAAHRIIVAGLAALSSLPQLSEEGAGIAWAERRAWQRYWLIDPLDGTREFIARNGEFTVNIALIDAGKPVLGVVHAPVLQRTYFAAGGTGAFRQDGEEAAVRIHARAASAGQALRVVASRSHTSRQEQEWLDLLGETSRVGMGSSLKFCLVAEGAADLYPRFGLTSEWDTAAAQCIVEEAGGAVLTGELTPLAYNAKESLLNPHFVVCNSSYATGLPTF